MKKISSAFQQRSAPTVMRVGETVYACVYAGRRWNDSGVDVVSGQIFNFSVPTGEQWRDWRQICSADGHTSPFCLRYCEIFRRVPSAKRLQLIGTIGKSLTYPFLIGSKLLDFLPAFPGRLYFFANDLPWMYWNNRGMIALRITRIK